MGKTMEKNKLKENEHFSRNLCTDETDDFEFSTNLRNKNRKNFSTADGCMISQPRESRMIRKDGSSLVENGFPSTGLDLHNLLSLIPLTCCPLQVRLFFWHYFARPIINSSWVLLAISIFGFYLITWIVLGGLFYSIVYSYEDYKADPTYCL